MAAGINFTVVVVTTEMTGDIPTGNLSWSYLLAQGEHLGISRKVQEFGSCGPQVRCYRIAENNLASIRTYGRAFRGIRVRTTIEHDSCKGSDEAGWTGVGGRVAVGRFGAGRREEARQAPAARLMGGGGTVVHAVGIED